MHIDEFMRIVRRVSNSCWTRYYLHWLSALEKIVAEKKIVPEDELARRKDEWDEAARATPHGQPIELRKKGTTT